MTWVAWRQQRPATVAAAIVLAVAGLVLGASGWQLTTQARDSGLAACVAAGGDCQVLVEAFTSRYGPILEPVSLLGALLPVALGLLFGGPLLAREFEQGTHRLAWTQSVTRSRWLAARLATAGGVLVVVSAVAAGLLTWWWGRFDALGISSRAALERGSLVPVATAVLAFAIAVAAGGLIRRVVPALATGLVAVLVVVLPLNLAAQAWLPPRPATITYPGRPAQPPGRPERPGPLERLPRPGRPGPVPPSLEPAVPWHRRAGGRPLPGRQPHPAPRPLPAGQPGLATRPDPVRPLPRRRGPVPRPGLVAHPPTRLTTPRWSWTVTTVVDHHPIRHSSTATLASVAARTAR
jgi:hypothetical protein